MASSASNPDLGRYFVSAQAYLPLMLKARFALRTSDFKNRTAEEKKILTLLATVDFSKDTLSQIQKLGKDKVDAVILSLVEENKPKPRKRPSLKIKILPQQGGSSTVVMTPLIVPTPQEQRKRAQQIAAEVMSRSASFVRLGQEAVPLKGNLIRIESEASDVEQVSKRDPLKKEKDFLVLHSNVKRALQNERIDDPFFQTFARQVIAAKSLLDQFMPFDKVIERCLGRGVLEKIISDYEIEGIRKLKPENSRESLLDLFIEQFGEPASSQYRPVSDNQKSDLSESEDKDEERKNRSKTILRVSSAVKPKLHPRSFTLSRISAGESSYPVELCNQELCTKMVQGVLVMKHLFKGVFKKIFSTKAKLRIAGCFIQYHLMSKNVHKVPAVLFETCFSKVFVSNRQEFSEVIGALLNPLTLKGMKDEPHAPRAEKLPEIFLELPFSDRKKTGSFIHFLALQKYLFETTYLVTFSDDEKKHTEFLLEVSALMDALNCEFEIAFKYMIGEFDRFNPEVVRSLFQKSEMGAIPEKKREPTPGELTRLIEGEIYFQHPILFAFLMETVRGNLIRCRGIQTRKVGELLIAVQNRIHLEPISLASALQSSLNIPSLKLIFQTEDELEITQHLNRELSFFQPRFILKNLCLDSEQEFRRVCEKATQYSTKKIQDPKLILALEYLCEIHELMQEEGWNWICAKTRYLNNEALRYLFDSTDDAENCQHINAAFALLKE